MPISAHRLRSSHLLILGLQIYLTNAGNFNLINNNDSLPYFTFGSDCGRVNSIADLQILRIAGGRQAIRNRWPWVAFFKGTSNETCVGSLVHPRYVLTAAHCRLMGNRISDFSIRLGEHRIYDNDSTEFESKVRRFIMHPKHEVDLYVTHDIALIELATPAPLNKFIQLACLPKRSRNLPTGTNLTIAGWGYVNATNYKPGILQEVTLPIVDTKECERRYIPYLNATLIDDIYNKSTSVSMREAWLARWFVKLSKLPPLDYICLASANKQDSCKGDSGGPVMYREGNVWVVYAFVVGGPGACGESWLPSINTDISIYIDWIVETIQNGEARLNASAGAGAGVDFSSRTSSANRLTALTSLEAVLYLTLSLLVSARF